MEVEGTLAGTSRVGFVTGAGSGIGRATAKRLGAEGLAVVCSDIDERTAAETAGAIKAAGGRAESCRVDVRRRADVEAAAELVMKEFGGLTHLVNNAGVVTMHGLDELTDDDWNFVDGHQPQGPVRRHPGAGCRRSRQPAGAPSSTCQPSRRRSSPPAAPTASRTTTHPKAASRCSPRRWLTS